MNVTEVLQFADKLVFSQTGKHLDDSQETVVKGVWEGKTYEEIADQSNRSERHIRDVGYKLWELLSQALGEDIKKTNFRSTLERVYIKSSQNICIGTNHNFTFSSQTLNNPNQNNRETDIKSQSPYYDLTLTPKIINFYNRESELKALSSWILDNNIRLI